MFEVDEALFHLLFATAQQTLTLDLIAELSPLHAELQLSWNKKGHKIG